MSEDTEERKNEEGIESAPVEAAAPAKEEEKVEVVEESPVKERTQFVLHKFEKAAKKEYTFSGEDLLMYGIGILALVVAAYVYGRLSVEVVGE
jgi:hypothetical protein